MINLGTSTMQDFALGDNLVERIDLGDTTIFGPYTTLTGTLPLTFNSRAAVALKNYRIYGTSEGAGVETENLFDKDATDTNNGYIQGAYLTSDGVSHNTNSYNVSEYTPINASEENISITCMASNTASLCFYSETYSYISGKALSSNTFTIPIPSNAKYFRISIVGAYTESNPLMVNYGIEPLSPRPYGYKIPILNTSGVTENLWSFTTQPLSGIGYLYNGSINLPAGTYTLRADLISGNANMSLAVVDNQGTTVINSTIYNHGSRTFMSDYDMTQLRFYVGDTIDELYLTLVKGSTAPDHYIPHRYTSNYDLFIGDTKLGAEEYADYGEQKVYKLKEVHKDTVTIDGIEWDILGYDQDEVYDGQGNLAQHSVTIQTHDCISELQFDAKEALFAFPEGLAAGTYHFTVSQQPWYAGDVGKTMQFTLTNAIPADGVIVISNAYNATMIGSTISVYASCSATTATETATISEGNDGTDLGSVGNAISGNTNSIQRAMLGNNNYNESAIRQYLNSDGTAGTYWMPQNKWDRPPSWAAYTAGLLYRMDPEFISVIGKVKKRTAKNTVSDGGGYIDTEEKVFLLSRTEVYAGTNNSVDEGGPYRYFSEFSDLSSAGTGADSNRTKYMNNVAKFWWLRSPVTYSASYPFYAYPSGAVNINSAATGVSRVAPACCIVLDDINANPYLQSLFLKPTDPPAPLPAIQAYQGENTLSSTETLGEVTVKGRISEISP